MNKTIIFFLVCLFLPGHVIAQNKEIVGWVERVRIYPGKLSLKAKLDTGSKTSSLHAPHVVKFKHEGKDWVRFAVANEKGKVVTIEREIYRTVKIKRRNSKPEERIIIQMDICLGSVYKTTEVSLVNRGNLIYPVLLGRRFLQGSFIIDPGETFTHRPKCKGILK